MKQPGHRLAKNTHGEPLVDQGTEGRFYLSFNPDDERFYVCVNDDGTGTRATFKRFDNAVQWARRH